ncbi:MAG: cytochrome b N-terminal domain-containing protein, partial [Nitrospirae bacterium]|nr:cytochrome b N-terminal domain-containing protein [Nitrospirota bacterium]
PWTQLSYWGATIGTEMPGATPIVGEWLVHLIRGGAQITGITLTRFYAIHVVVLPLTLVGFLGLHFIMIRMVGISRPL